MNEHIHQKFMKMALEQAQLGIPLAFPNPSVGAVVVKNGNVIGKGFTLPFGGEHAEFMAINNCIESPEGADLYATLEPCCHQDKKTPPCTSIIIEKKIKRVFVATLDPNPKVNGKGIELLRKNNIEVKVGMLEQPAKIQNEIFFVNQKLKRPFVFLKLAQTLDAKVASEDGKSRWITGAESRNKVHQLRSHYGAVMIGSNTALADNPKLNVRSTEKNLRPVKRIIVGNYQKLPSHFNLVSDQLMDQTYIFTAEHPPFKNSPPLHIFTLPGNSEGKLNVQEILDLCFKNEIYAILLEGGPQLASEFLRQHLVDRVGIFIAPKILGTGQNSISSLDITSLDHALELNDVHFSQYGQDILVEGIPNYKQTSK